MREFLIPCFALILAFQLVAESTVASPSVNSVIPTKVGIQEKQAITNCTRFYMEIRDFPNILKFLDSRFRGNDTSQLIPGTTSSAGHPQLGNWKHSATLETEKKRGAYFTILLPVGVTLSAVGVTYFLFAARSKL